MVHPEAGKREHGEQMVGSGALAPSRVHGQSIWSGGQEWTPLKQKSVWQLYPGFLLRYFVSFEYFFHVYMLHLVCELYASNGNVAVLATACDWRGGMARLAPWIGQWP